MRNPRRPQPGRAYTISCTDEEMEVIRAGAARAGMKVSPWFVQCALTVDPWAQEHRRLTLDASQQRYIVRAVDGIIRGFHSNDDPPSQFTHDLRALFEARLGTMFRQGRVDKALTLLKTVFGDERAELIAAAFMPDAKATSAPLEKRGKSEPKTEKESDRDRPPQGEFRF